MDHQINNPNEEIDELTPTSTEEEQREISRKIAIEVLWNRGNLDYRLDDLQREMKRQFYNSKRKVNVWLTSRRLGKSTLLCALAIERCIKSPGSIVKFLSPEMKQTRSLSSTIFNDLIKDAPKNLKPEFKTQEMLWRFPNKSEIHLAGSDNGGAEKLRGAQADLCIVDEAGFCDNLKYAVRTILLPTMLTTGGKMILSSTPSIRADHEFNEFIEEAEINKVLVRKTIYDSPRYSSDFIESEILNQYPGGKTDPEFRREYLCEVFRSEELSVIPEFTEELQAEVVKDWPRPPHFDSYVAIDYGVRDLTVALFAYYDFRAGKIIVEDEVVMNGVRMNTAILAAAIKKKEGDLWHDKYTKQPMAPYLRVSDNNLLLIQDLQSQHGLNFIPTDKHNKEGFLNQLRLLIQDKRIIIHPRCNTLINHLKHASWDKDRKKFRRSAALGHADCIDALLYLTRNVSLTKNPYPAGSYGFDVHVPQELLKPQVSQQARTIEKIFDFKPQRSRFNK